MGLYESRAPHHHVLLLQKKDNVFFTKPNSTGLQATSLRIFQHIGVEREKLDKRTSATPATHPLSLTASSCHLGWCKLL